MCGPKVPVLMLIMALAGCSADTNPIRDVAVATGIGVEPKPAPDFVRRTRPERVDYVPVAAVPQPPRPAKSAAEVKAAEDALEASRTANEAAAEEARKAGAAVAR
jgi:ribosomal protein L12E/L44/L45/RPP1/RPP2